MGIWTPPARKMLKERKKVEPTLIWLPQGSSTWKQGLWIWFESGGAQVGKFLQKRYHQHMFQLVVFLQKFFCYGNILAVSTSVPLTYFLFYDNSYCHAEDHDIFYRSLTFWVSVKSPKKFQNSTNKSNLHGYVVPPSPRPYQVGSKLCASALKVGGGT